jgi:hypothetical protein
MIGDDRNPRSTAGEIRRPMDPSIRLMRYGRVRPMAEERSLLYRLLFG